MKDTATGCSTCEHYEDLLRMLADRGCEVDKPWMCLAECPDDSTEWCGPCVAHAALTSAANNGSRADHREDDRG